MTDEQHMQKAREVRDAMYAEIRKLNEHTLDLPYSERVKTEVTIIASAISEAYRSGVEAERERIASDIEAIARISGRLQPDISVALKKVASVLRKA
jgi:hypothetical protein